MKSGITNLPCYGFKRDGKTLIIDDMFEVSEKIKNMPYEEREKRIRILEEQGRREKAKIKPENRKTLKVVGM